MPDVIDASPAADVARVDQAAGFAWDGNKLEPGIGLALSGGGFRAMLFHAGALLRLNELGLLAKVSRISSVSGGSIAAGYLGASWQRLGPADAQGVFSDFRAKFVEPVVRFSGERIDVVDALTGLLPWTSAAEEVAKSYQRLMGSGTLQGLPDTPRFVFCATNLQTGVLWRFSKPYAGDYIVGRIDRPTTRIAEAVAASSAFPPVLSPMVLRVLASSFRPWPNDNPTLPASELAAFRAQVILTDGGVYDNHGMEPIVKRYMTVFVSDGGAPFGRSGNPPVDWISQLRRVLEVTDNQVRALRRRDLIARLREGNRAFAAGTLRADEVRPRERMGAYWGIDTDAAKLDPPDALPCSSDVTDRLARVATRLSDLGERTSHELVNWGYAICDRSVRANYRGPVALLSTAPRWPFPDAALSDG